GERARRALGSCSAPFEACLDRAARSIGADAVVVSSFRERRGSLGDLGGFRYLRTEPPPAVPAPALPAAKPGSTRVVRLGRSAASRIWAAALEAAEGEMGGGDTEIAVADTAGAETTGWTLVPMTSSSGAFTIHNSQPTTSISLAEDAALAAG